MGLAGRKAHAAQRTFPAALLGLHRQAWRWSARPVPQLLPRVLRQRQQCLDSPCRSCAAATAATAAADALLPAACCVPPTGALPAAARCRYSAATAGMVLTLSCCKSDLQLLAQVQKEAGLAGPGHSPHLTAQQSAERREAGPRTHPILHTPDGSAGGAAGGECAA